MNDEEYDRRIDLREGGTGIEREECAPSCRECQWYVGLPPVCDIGAIIDELAPYCPPGLIASVRERVVEASFAHVCFYDGHERYADDEPCEMLEEQ